MAQNILQTQNYSKSLATILNASIEVIGSVHLAQPAYSYYYQSTCKQRMIDDTFRNSKRIQKQKDNC